MEWFWERVFPWVLALVLLGVAAAFIIGAFHGATFCIGWCK